MYRSRNSSNDLEISNFTEEDEILKQADQYVEETWYSPIRKFFSEDNLAKEIGIGIFFFILVVVFILVIIKCTRRRHPPSLPPTPAVKTSFKLFNDTFLESTKSSSDDRFFQKRKLDNSLKFHEFLGPERTGSKTSDTIYSEIIIESPEHYDLINDKSNFNIHSKNNEWNDNKDFNLPRQKDKELTDSSGSYNEYSQDPTTILTAPDGQMYKFVYFKPDNTLQECAEDGAPSSVQLRSESIVSKEKRSKEIGDTIIVGTLKPLTNGEITSLDRQHQKRKKMRTKQTSLDNPNKLGASVVATKARGNFVANAASTTNFYLPMTTGSLNRNFLVPRSSKDRSKNDDYVLKNTQSTSFEIEESSEGATAGTKSNQPAIPENDQNNSSTNKPNSSVVADCKNLSHEDLYA